MCTGCSLCWDFCPRGGLRYEALWPPSTTDGSPRGPNRRPAAVERADAVGHLLEDHRRPSRATASVRCSTPTRSAPGARPDGAQDGGVVSALLDRRAGRRRDRRCPGDPAERRPRRAVEGGGPPRHHAPRRSSTPPAATTTRPWRSPSSTSRSYDLPAKPRIAVVGHALRDPGHPGHAVEAVADRRPPGRRGGADHRPPLHQELRLPGPDAPAAPGGPGHRHRAGEQGRRDPRAG